MKAIQITMDDELLARLDADEEVVRDGRRFTVPVKLAERPRRGDEVDEPSEPLSNRARTRPQEPRAQPVLGVSVRELDRGFQGRLDIPDSVQGVVVARVDPTGAAFGVLRRGCVVMEINRRPIRSVADYDRIVSAAKPGSILAIYFYDPTLAQRTLAAVTVD